MKLTIGDLETWRGQPVSIRKTDGDTVIGAYTGLIPADPLGPKRAGRPRVVIKDATTVAYIRTDEVAEIVADGRRRPRCAA